MSIGPVPCSDSDSMLHRIAIFSIIGFWLAMTSLLIIREVYPDATNLNTVPAQHAASLLFQNEQPSDLKIYDGAKDAGYIRIAPRIQKKDKLRVLETQGNLALKLPGDCPRISWIGKIEMNAAYQITQLEMTLSTEEERKIEIFYQGASKTLRYKASADGHLFADNEIQMNEQGIGSLLGQIGINTAFLSQFSSAPAGQSLVKYTATQSSIKISGSEIPTYLVTMKFGEQVMWAAHITRLGHIIKGHIPIFAYKALATGIQP